jgi:asparagine synthase (glutamine-hydrolysing)
VSPAEWAERVHEKLKESVRIHLRSDVPVSAWLSAGIDSSSIVALTREIRGEALQTFSMTFDGRPEVDEIASAHTLNQYPGFDIPNERLICKGEHFGLYPRLLWHQEDPTTSGVPIIQMLLAEATVKKYKVVMTGEGADEFFAGYPWYRFNMLVRPFSILPRLVRSAMIVEPLVRPWKELSTQIFLAPREMGLERYANLIGLYYPRKLPSLYANDMRAVLQNAPVLPEHLNGLKTARGWDDLSKLQYIEDKTRLCDLITHNLDRSSMANSLELRVPFLDHEFVELALQIPSGLKLRRHKEKYILREAMRPYLPREIIERKKRGLNTPTPAWFREKLPDFAEAMLSREMAKRKGYFDHVTVEKLLRDHRARKADLSRPLIAIVGIHMWDELFMHHDKKQM